MVSCDSDLRQILFQELSEKEKFVYKVERISGGSINKKINIFVRSQNPP